MTPPAARPARPAPSGWSEARKKAFKAIKQNLKIKTFIGLSENAVLTQIWGAMIAYLLTAFARHSAKEGWTVQRILRVLQVNLFERKPLKDLLKPTSRHKQKDHPQMRMVI